MHDSTLPLARRDLIAHRLDAGQSVHSGALATEFGVSEDAIRRDLRALAQQGLCRRVYGGALPLSPASGPVAARQAEAPAQKQALAQVACGLIQPGMTLFLDTGSTVAHLAAHLPVLPDLRVITNSLPAAAVLMQRNDLSLVLIGGGVDPSTGGCTDARAQAALALYRFDLCFLGACALSQKQGLAGFDLADVDFKRQLIDRSAETALMMTTAKLETTAPYAIAGLDAVADYILAADAPAPVADALRAAGARVHLAHPDRSMT
ncbi:DeoR family transcriptional regulator [Gemmobacter caeni]|uniref:DeoR family transcriptional regulator n=1 Tax=Gemmobacter caeni TaxID=589035 RepID=A0A2T6B0J3_9RHOB|nr:DeoR/GlpR family DNA-binding transcription regulator [Gemmobacter caeni]PTX49588.1 DeoR family transcriptional regulator [Gemmobacter caeni]TWJ00365.1 DeoR family transcriptional regulator [Gemmobacter caeni]